MSNLSLSPYAPLQFFKDDGTPAALYLLYTYLSGSSTPATTYADDATPPTANSNPITLDAAGRCVVYLDAKSYKFVLKTPSGTTVWTQDAIRSITQIALGTTDNSLCQGRLTLQSGQPEADQAASATLYWTPYKGNRLALYDTSISAWVGYSFSELSTSLAAISANKNYDVFVYDNSGVLTLELVVWTSNTVRATAIVLQDGVYVKSGSANKRYLGSVRSDSGGGTVSDTQSKRHVYNLYNKLARPVSVTDSTASWTYTTASFRQANNAVANQVTVMVGVADIAAHIEAIGNAANTNTGVGLVSAIGIDSTTAASGKFGSCETQVANLKVVPRGVLDAGGGNLSAIASPAFVTFVWLEYSEAVGTTTWYGSASPKPQTGLSGWILM